MPLSMVFFCWCMYVCKQVPSLFQMPEKDISSSYHNWNYFARRTPIKNSNVHVLSISQSLFCKKITLCAHTLRFLCFKFAWLEFYVVIKGKLVPVIELLSFYYLGLIRVVSHFGIWYGAVTHFHITKFGIQWQDLWISFLSKLHVIATVVSY